MCRRNIRAVLSDVHGTLFTKEVTDMASVPATGRAHWADCFSRAIHEEFKLDCSFDPLELWRLRAEIELRTPREKNGRPITPRKYQLYVNELVLRGILPDLMKGIQPQVRRRMARNIRNLHRTEEGRLVAPVDMLEFMRALHACNIFFYLHTAQTKKKVCALMRQEKIRKSLVDGIHTTESIGFSKMRVEFWNRFLEIISLEPQEVVVIGNNLIMDSSCTAAGIPAFILDRDGLQAEYFSPRGHLRGAKFVTRVEEMPPKAPFIGFGRTPGEFLRWIDGINAVQETVEEEAIVAVSVAR